MRKKRHSLKKQPIERKTRKLDWEALLEYCNKNPFAAHVEAGRHFNCSERVIRYEKKAMKITRKKDKMLQRNEEKRARFKQK